MGILGFTGVLTGLPILPFLLVGAGLGALAYAAKRATAAPVTVTTPRTIEPPKTGPEDMTSLLAVEPLELELGFGLLFLVEGASGDLLDRGRAHSSSTGAGPGNLPVVPPVRIRDSSLLPPNSYALKIRGLEVARGELMPGHALALSDSHDGRNLTALLRGVPAKDRCLVSRRSGCPIRKNERRPRKGLRWSTMGRCSPPI